VPTLTGLSIYKFITLAIVKADVDEAGVVGGVTIGRSATTQHNHHITWINLVNDFPVTVFGKSTLLQYLLYMPILMPFMYYNAYHMEKPYHLI